MRPPQLQVSNYLVLCGDWSIHDDVCEVDGVQGPSSTWLEEVKIMLFPPFIRAGCGLLTQVFVRVKPEKFYKVRASTRREP